jgi:predicted HTH transcriptional regulator
MKIKHKQWGIGTVLYEISGGYKLLVNFDNHGKIQVLQKDCEEVSDNTVEKVSDKNTKNISDFKNLCNLPLAQIFNEDESIILEFKSSLKYSYDEEKADKQLVLVILKTICAFLNTLGGILIVGVADDKKILGLSEDYKVCNSKKPDWDGWILYLQEHISNSMGVGVTTNIKIDRNELGENDDKKEIAKIIVEKSKKMVFVKTPAESTTYVRLHAMSKKLDAEETMKWAQQHGRSL